MDAIVANKHESDEVEFLRARFYGLLSYLLAAPPSRETLGFLRALEGDDTEIGKALGTLAEVASETSLEAAGDEFSALFIGMGQGGELTPYASYYLTGFVHEKPLAALRADMAALGVTPTGKSCEPEDYIATLCEIMHGLISGCFGEAADMIAQRTFFRTHVETWACRFFKDLEEAESACLYRPVGTIGRLFMAIESEAFGMAP